MASVGLSTNLKSLRGLGLKPMYVGAASALIVGGIGLFLAMLVGPRIHPIAPAMAATAPIAKNVVEAAPPREMSEPAVPVVVAATGPRDADRAAAPDVDDACTIADGSGRRHSAKPGCPLAVVDHGQIQLVEPIKFAAGTAKLLPQSKPALLALLQLLQARPDIRRIAVDGYMDNRATERTNVDLSERRASAVVRWLARHKVPRSRLESYGFGSDNPIDTNDTVDGRRNNRRVEVRILESDDVTPSAKRAP